MNFPKFVKSIKSMKLQQKIESKAKKLYKQYFPKALKLYLPKSSIFRTNPMIGFIIFIFAYTFYEFRVDSAIITYFDEFAYLSAAKQLLTRGINENWSHPPLGKALISVGLFLFGDNNLGWRFSSIFFGAVILVAMYFLGLLLLKEKKLAILVVLLSAFNQILFIESRITAVETPMFAFVSIGLVLFLYYWLDHRSEKFLITSSLSFGVAIAIKWFAVVPMVLCLGLLFLEKPNKAGKKSGKSKKLKLEKSKPFLISAASILGIYFATFLIYLGMQHPSYAPNLHEKQDTQQATETYSLKDIFSVQVPMLKANLNFQPDRPLIHRSWYSWPLMTKPTWYQYPYMVKEETGIRKQGIAVIGNPVIMWVGLISIFLCVLIYRKRRSKEALFIFSMYFGMYLVWSIFPRITTYYYYYLPSAMILSLGIVYAFQYFKVRYSWQLAYLLLAIGFFSYSYPLLSNMPLSESEFNKRLAFISFGNFTSKSDYF